jgi:hypothetical protein
VSEAHAPSSPRERRWGRGVAVMLLLGATLGTLLDAIHTQSRATKYTHPVLLDTAWWLPLLFAGAYAIGLLRPLFDRGPARSLREAVSAMGLFALAYACSVLPLAWPATSALLFAIFAVSFVLFDRSRIGAAIAAGGAIGGPAFESFLVHQGVFEHTRPAYAGVSGWLPFLYLAAAVGLQAMAKWLVDGGGSGR